MSFTIVAMILLIFNVNGYNISQWIIFGLCGVALIWFFVMYSYIGKQNRLISSASKELNKIVNQIKLTESLKELDKATKNLLESMRKAKEREETDDRK